MPGLQAGDEVAPPPVSTPKAEADAFDWLTPSLNIRSRLEYREVGDADPSWAGTIRARGGLKIGDFNGFSAFVELEATEAFIDDYRSNPTGLVVTEPYVVGNTPIGDPENGELNQAWVQYKNDFVGIKVGRQRIIRNGAAFIGNVGWRQNEQTYDAAELTLTPIDGLKLSYAYSDKALRIFGDDPRGTPLHSFDGEFHLLDASYKADFGTIGGYAYLIDVENPQTPARNVGESNTFGVFYKSGPIYAELAYQDGTTGAAERDYETLYGHFTYTHSIGKTKLIAGVEYLGDDFKTPFATVHKFNGFADRFILQRIGLNNAGGAYNGITDVYLGYVKPGLPGGLVFKGFLHYFMDADLGKTYGYEADAVLVKKITPNLKALAKFAYYVGDDEGTAFDGDIKQASIQLDYSF